MKSSAGTMLDLSLTYNSYNADTSRARFNTVLGIGWTHSYNLFLFSQVGSIPRRRQRAGDHIPARSRWDRAQCRGPC